MTRKINAIFKQKGITLTQEQLRAIKADGVSIISAGPGSAKTTTLVAKILHFESKNQYSNVLAITFSKRAAEELRKRTINCNNVNVSTFHSFFYKILRANGYKNFRFIENNSEKRMIVQKIIDDSKENIKLSTDDFLKIICTGTISNDMEKIAINNYLEYLKEHRILCYDSLQYFVAEILDSCPRLSEDIRNHYDLTVIDEGQDISILQFLIIKAIWYENSNLTIVGDEHQAIYGFRGSHPNVLEELRKHYGAPIYYLTNNFRSTQQILDLAETVISRKLKSATKKTGDKPILYKASSLEDEALYVIDKINDLVNHGAKYSDIAIIYRSNPYTYVMSEKLFNADIPFIQYGCIGSRWNDSIVKKFIALINIIYDTKDFKNYLIALPILGVSINIAKDMIRYFDKRSALIECPLLSKSTRTSLKVFFSINKEKLSIKEIVYLLWNNYLKEYLNENTDDYLNNFLNLIIECDNYEQLKDTIYQYFKRKKAMKLLADAPNANAVKMMAIHSAKGKEFKHVFIINVYDGLIPSNNHLVNIAEERRILYVGITRAMDSLFITYPKNIGKFKNELSRFLREEYFQ